MTGPDEKIETRQLYASIREDIYLAAKARAAEMRIPLRRLLEMALERALAGEKQEEAAAPEPAGPPSIWDDEYLRMQASQPLGSPVELTRDEAERLVRDSFGAHGPGPPDSGAAQGPVTGPENG